MVQVDGSSLISSSDWRRAASNHNIRFPREARGITQSEGDMATILLVGTDVPLLEGLAQTLAAVGHNTQIAASLAEAMEAAAIEPPLVAVIDRALILPAGEALRIPLARGGTLVVYRPDGATASALPVAVQRAVLADLRLPLERHRLVALLQHVEGRARSTGRDRVQTPPERHPTV